MEINNRWTTFSNELFSSSHCFLIFSKLFLGMKSREGVSGRCWKGKVLISDSLCSSQLIYTIWSRSLSFKVSHPVSTARHCLPAGGWLYYQLLRFSTMHPSNTQKERSRARTPRGVSPETTNQLRGTPLHCGDWWTQYLSGKATTDRALNQKFTFGF